MKKNTKSTSLNYIGFAVSLLAVAAHDINTVSPWMPYTLRGNALSVSGDANICGTMTVKGAILNTAMGNLSNIISPDGSVTITPGSDALRLQSTPLSGNVLRVDAALGNDATGARNGKAFATISAALQAAHANDVVLLLPGTYNETLVIPNGITILGLSAGGLQQGGVRIVQNNVTTATDLVTMGENTRLENVTLNLSASADVQLRGIVFPGTSSLTSSVNAVRLQINNTVSGTSPVYGVHSNGTGQPNTDVFALQGSSISISTLGIQTTRGVLIDTAANNFNLSNCTILVSNNAGGSAIGIETNIAGASCIATTSTINGESADISQTNPSSSITIANSFLANATANNLGFTSTAPASIIAWAVPGALATGTSIMTPGTGSLVAPNANLPYIVPQTGVIKNLNVQAMTPPGLNGTTTFTLLRNGISTTLSASLSNNQITCSNNNVSVPCYAGDQITIQVSNVIGAPANVSATVELY